MNHIFSIFRMLLLVLLVGSLASCKKDNEDPSVEDSFLNYEIEEIPVTENYNVGAFYTFFTTFNANVKETPVLGKYTMSNVSGVPLNIMQAHLGYAVQGGIDYFVFNFRSLNRDVNNYKIDTTVIRSYLNAGPENKVKFAINYNFSSYALTDAAPLESNAQKLSQFYDDFAKMEKYFKNPNYMKVDGKALIFINDSRNLYSNDNKAIYTELRSRLRALGVELYIVGNQERWSPPARYAPARFAGCVDAVYHQSLLLNNAYAWDFFYVLPQAMDQNLKYNREYLAQHYSLEYIPNIYPGNDFKITAPTSVFPNVERKDGGAMYRKLCNVAKMNVNNKGRLVLIDSFNDWANGTQLEPAQSYTDSYLNITKQQFKR
ncbi:glycoside hydrolase family 99-like domain-containing protein [Mucilaginibacter sp. PAMB04168]|uniref:glycoside hydrolase family 99-like domain-containing protein n=1 Tax=Mucilaginibacter sp. PAMB04168 TaxID=3138567 RepID=UPI0031F68391